MSQNYLALDPGGTTGWALMCEGKPTTMGEVPFEHIFQWLLQEDWKEIGLWVVEDYIVRPANVQGGYAHQWNKGEALRIIGAVELLTTGQGAELIKQQPSIKPQASKISGVPYTPGKSGTHMFDAVLHGAWYWWKETGPNATDETSISGGDPTEPGVRPPARVAQISSYKGLRKAGNKKRL